MRDCRKGGGKGREDKGQGKGREGRKGKGWIEKGKGGGKLSGGCHGHFRLMYDEGKREMRRRLGRRWERQKLE